MFCLNLENFLFLYLSLWTVANGSDSSKMECSKPQCFIYNKRNASIEVKVRYSELKKSTVTTFCFGGLLKSVLHLWINPVLHIAKSEASPNETSKFITYYGSSVSDVHEKSKRQGYVVLQSVLNSLQPLKQTDDLALEPFNLSCYIIDTNIDYKAKVKIKAADLWFIAYLIIGIVIFFSANSWSNIYHQVVDTWNRINVSTAGLSRPFTRAADGLNMAASSAYYTLPSFMQTGLYDFYREWEMFYVDTYKWIHPKLTELSNTALHYSTGVSVGVIASVLILVFIISRLLPSRLKNLGYLLMFFGGSASLWVLTTFTSILNNPMADTVVENWQYVLGYIVTAGVLSFAIVYRYGPVTDERSLSLIQWFLQLMGLALVYNSTQIREVSIALIIILLTIYNFPRRLILNERSKNWWYRLFPPKIKLLTEDEYIIQGNIETKRELDKLRDYCRSPECQAWKMISKLKSPQRFADFVEGNSWHVTNEELLEYDSGPDPTPPHLLSDDDDLEEEEMDFILSSP